MKRASNTFSLLQAIAATAGLAILLWSIGLPSLRFAEAANVTFFSDTLSTSDPSVAADHEIAYTANAGLVATESITLTFESGIDISAIAVGDIDFDNGSGNQTLQAGAASGATWGVTFGAQTITITSGTGTIAPSAVVTILIGQNATGGSNQIVNPGTAGTSYTIGLVSGSDTGQTEIAIVDTVSVTASVDTLFTFTVAGVAGGVTVNGSDTTGGTTTATTIPFGKLDAGVASTAAQNLSVTTNAKNGFVVTVTSDGQLLSNSGADIDSYIEGANTSSPTAWTTPTPTPGLENEYGHWGLSSNDTSLTAGLSNLYTGGLNFVAASTSPIEVFRHDGPVSGAGAGEGTAEVIYKVEISNLQEAATDYSAILTYVATPVF